jgi:hypothetical protein
MSGTVQNIELGRQGKSAFSLDAWYGVEYDITNANPVLTRIGRADLISSQPVYNAFKARVKRDDGTTVYQLDPTNHTRKEDGSAANLTGTAGQVIIDMPMHYCKVETSGNTVRIKQSMYPLAGFVQVKKYGFGKYLASLDAGGKLASVSGSTALVNRACDVTTSTGFQKLAEARGAGWSAMKASAYNSLQLCELVYTASFDAQTAISFGLLNANDTDYSARGYGAVKASGNSNPFGRFTGSAPVTVNNWYVGTVTSISASKCVATGRFVTASWKVEFIGATIRNDTTLATATIISRDSNDQITISADIFTVIGQKFTIINSTLVTNSAVFAGIEDYFGHLWQYTPGVLFEMTGYATGDVSNKAYIVDKRNQFANTITADYRLIGSIPVASGWGKNLLPGWYIPSSTGGSSATYLCDYVYITTSNGLRVGLVGGMAISGVTGGSRCLFAYNAPGNASPNVSSRLCYEYSDSQQEDI